MVWKANAVDCSAIAFQQQGPGVLLKCEKLVWEKVWLRQQGNDPLLKRIAHLFVGERFTPRLPLESDLGAELNEEDGAKMNCLGEDG